MPTQNPVKNSRAHRWAYACGMSVKRGYRKLKAFEYRLAERAVTAGMPAGKLVVRGSFLIAQLALLGAFLFVRETLKKTSKSGEIRLSHELNG
ncbi:hypothetical protein [Pseudomonas veronii]|uniref:hypothetical protein n=1 Tax=Pseudomonas veronii TaxID=76761 RepID=UPI003B972309